MTYLRLATWKVVRKKQRRTKHARQLDEANIYYSKACVTWEFVKQHYCAGRPRELDGALDRLRQHGRVTGAKTQHEEHVTASGKLLSLAEKLEARKEFLDRWETDFLQLCSEDLDDETIADIETADKNGYCAMISDSLSCMHHRGHLQ